MKAFYADTVNGCQAITTAEANDFPCITSNDASEVIADLHDLKTPTSYLVSDEVYAEVSDVFGIK